MDRRKCLVLLASVLTGWFAPFSVRAEGISPPAALNGDSLDPCQVMPAPQPHTFKKGPAAISEKWHDYQRQEARAVALESELWRGLQCLAKQYDVLQTSIGNFEKNAKVKFDALTDTNHKDAVIALSKFEAQRKLLDQIAQELKQIDLGCKGCAQGPGGPKLIDNGHAPGPYVYTWFDQHGSTLLEGVKQIPEIVRSIKSDCKSAACCRKCSTSGGTADLSVELKVLDDSVASFQIAADALVKTLALIDAETEGRGKVTSTRQFDPKADIRTFIRDDKATVEVALATVPDPRVPRHRRAYDNAIDAISNAMLISGFVMDRFSFPWQDVLAGRASGATPEGSPNGDVSGKQNVFTADDSRFGAIVFRNDAWRDEKVGTNSLPATEYRLIYVVPEVATYGIPRPALEKVFEQIQKEWRRGAGITPAASSFCPREATLQLNERELLVFGPTYSGTLESLRSFAGTFTKTGSESGLRIGGVCLLSATATASTNRVLDHYIQPDSPLRVRSIAVEDSARLQFVNSLRRELNVRPNHIAFLYESTVFGNDICGRMLGEGSALTVCRDALLVPFPVNIADVRYGLHIDAATEKKEQKDLELPLPVEPHLHLEQGAENGSEFPQSDQSGLTTAGNEANLDHAIEDIVVRHPQIVVIVATDVRDQLFLIERVHRLLPSSLLVVFGADRLLAHPDFISSSRGAITIASSALETCITTSKGARKTAERTTQKIVSCENDRLKSLDPSADNPKTLDASWVTDDQALLARAILSWIPAIDDGDPTIDRCNSAELPNKNPCPMLVARNGIRGEFAGSSSSRVKRYFLRLLLPVTAVAITLIAIFGFKAAPVPDRLTLQSEFRNGLRLGAVRTFFSVYVLVMILALLLVSLELGPWRVPVVGIGVLSLAWYHRERWRTISWESLATRLLYVSLMGLIVLECVHATNATPDFRDLASLNETMFSVSKSAPSGLSYPMAFIVVVLTLLGASWTVSRMKTTLVAADSLLTTATVSPVGVAGSPDAAPQLEGPDINLPQYQQDLNRNFGKELLGDVRRPFENAGRVTIVLLGGWLALMLASAIDQWLRLTVFGAMASLIAWVALMTITAMAIAMFVGAVASSGRLLALCSRVEELCRKEAARTGIEMDEKWNPLLWDKVPGSWPRFPPTPALALVQRWEGDKEPNLGGLLSVESRASLHQLLTREMSIYHWSLVGTILLSLAAGVVVYLFPITSSDQLLMTNLGILFAAGLHSAYMSVRFEADRVLSNVLCNRAHKVEWSVGLFTYIAFPFASLAIGIAIAEVPGVLNWGGGIFSLVLEILKPKL